MLSYILHMYFTTVGFLEKKILDNHPLKITLLIILTVFDAMQMLTSSVQHAPFKNKRLMFLVFFSLYVQTTSRTKRLIEMEIIVV